MELQEHDPWLAVGGATSFAAFMKRQRPEASGPWRPTLEAFHRADEMVLRFEIPGVLAEDIVLRVDHRVLTVCGERRRTEQPPESVLMRDERTYGPFDRSIALPEGTDPASVSATYHLGVLEVRVAHNRRRQPRTVEVVAEQLSPVPVVLTHE